ncbi:uncharacterized protein LOC119173336 isoform X4 [Rhipicephalus microplus]|uniref:uncharacterized protein LOC119173336 isoform X4 n=1 Tax=Rhipicephalus microplus TaxID=6941 RepID=UPI003F6D0FCC
MKRTALYRVTFLCIALQTVEAVGLPRIGGIPGHVFNLAASAPWCFHGIFTGVLEICGLEMSPVGKFMPVVVRKNTHPSCSMCCVVRKLGWCSRFESSVHGHPAVGH